MLSILKRERPKVYKRSEQPGCHICIASITSRVIGLHSIDDLRVVEEIKDTSDYSVDLTMYYASSRSQ